MEELTNVTTEETKDEVVSYHDDAEDNYNESSDSSGLGALAIGGLLIAGVTAIGAVLFKKHKDKKKKEDKEKWKRNVDSDRSKDKAEDASEPDEVVDEKDVPKNTKKK